MLHGDTEGGSPGSSIEETCSVGSVLYVVAESQEFFVIVETRSIHARNARADSGRTSQSDQDKALFAPAERADIVLMICFR